MVKTQHHVKSQGVISFIATEILTKMVRKGTKIFQFNYICNMKLFRHILTGLLLTLLLLPASASKDMGAYMLPFVMIDGDTVPSLSFKEMPVYPPVKKKAEKFYWKTVRDVKKVYPYVKIVGSEYARITAMLDTIPDEEVRTKLMKKYEKALLKQYEPTMRKFTLSQGKMMIKLIDRETNKTSYELIKEIRGGFVAFWWQAFAKMVGADLKEDFNLSTKEKDRIIERVITLYEAGML